MRIRVTFFAHARELAGTTVTEVDLAPGATAGTLLAALAARHPRLADLRAHLRLAVNQAYAPGDRVLAEGDDVAVIPPVSGG